MFRKSTLFRLFSLLLIAGMVFASLPAADVQAASGETLYVANWSTPVDAGVAGRPVVVFDGSIYHMWYGVGDHDLYYTTSSTPTGFAAGTKTTYTSNVPIEDSSPAILKNGGTFYMVAYGDTTNKFALYTSTNGIAWTYVKDIYTGEGLSDWTKIDCPMLLVDGSGYKLYFQVKSSISPTPYSIYVSTSSAIDGPYTAAALMLAPSVSGWDSFRVMHPMVVKDGGKYFMYYVGYDTTQQQKLGFAYSDDGVNWTKGLANPLISTRGAEPSVIVDSGTWHLWYLSEAPIRYFSATGPIEFSSIQAAITKATGGETIKVAPGKYVEDVVVDKALSLLGSGAASTTIVATTGNTTPLSFNTSGATVSGFTLTHEYTQAELDAWNFNNNGVTFGQNQTGNTLENCNVTMNRNGVYLNTTQSHVIRNNDLFNNRTGINLAGNVKNVQITGNQIRDNWTLGIVTYNPGSDFSTWNISGNTFSGNWYSEVLVKDAGTSTGILNLNGNTFADNPVTYTDSSDVSLNEPSYAALKPAFLGGTAVKPAKELPTLRIYNSPSASLKYDGKTLMVGADEPYKTIQSAITAAAAGDIIKVAPGTYTEVGQIVINKNLSIVGADKTTTIIKPAQSTGSVDDARGWFLVNSGVVFNLSNVTLDGAGMNIHTAIRSHGTGVIDNNIIKNIKYSKYMGLGVYVYGGTIVSNNTLSNIERVGLYANTEPTAVGHAIFRGNTYIGKGNVDGLDYGIEVERGATADIENNTISDCRGVASTDGSTSGGIYATTYFAPGTTVNVTGNVLNNNYIGVVVGYLADDSTTLIARNNKFSGNTYAFSTTSTTKYIDAIHNWFGSPAGPAAGQIDGLVNYVPWCADEACTKFMPDANGKIIIPSTFTPAQIQTALNNAPAGTTIVFSGTVPSIVDGYQVNNPHLTILLLNGTVIQNSSPCFVVNADYTRVTTESLGGAKCIPTSGSNGIDVTGNRINVIVEGLEIDGTGQLTGDGIHFGGTIQDFQILNNYIHDLDGNGIEFVSQPTGVQDIQGNLFNFITAAGILSPSSLNAEYNSWGNWTSAVNSGAVDAIPWTHADLTITESGTTWPNRVMPGNNISFRVSANLREVMGVEFKLPIPTGFTLVSATPVTGAFLPATGTSVLDTTTVPGVISYAGYATSVVTMENVPLFDVTLTAPASGGPFTFAVDGSTDKFGMAPVGGGPSNNIYAASLAGADFGLVTVYPQLTSTNFAGPYAAGYTQQFSLTVDNTAAGAVIFDTPQLQFVGLPAGTVLEYFDTTSVPPAWVPVSGGVQNLPASAANSTATYAFRVTFASAASINASINLVDTHFTNILDTLAATITVNPNYTVTGTFSMQGRSVRSGIPVTLTMAAPALYPPFNGTTLDILSNNLSIPNVAVATYVITTNQPRYLDVTATLNKMITVSSSKTSMTALQLKGGDANGDEAISVGDATAIGGAYNQPGGELVTADVNFSGLVDIFDLTIVGGNYNLTSAAAYSDTTGTTGINWIP